MTDFRNILEELSLKKYTRRFLKVISSKRVLFSILARSVGDACCTKFYNVAIVDALEEDPSGW